MSGGVETTRGHLWFGIIVPESTAQAAEEKRLAKSMKEYEYSCVAGMSELLYACF